MSNLALVLLIVLILAAIGIFPVWQHSAAWGPYPGGVILALLVIVIVLAMVGRL